MMTFGSISLRYLRVLCLLILAFALAGSFGAGTGWDDAARATLIERLDTPERNTMQGSRQAVLALAGDDVQGADDPLSDMVALSGFTPSHPARISKLNSNTALRGARLYLQAPIRAPPPSV